MIEAPEWVLSDQLFEQSSKSRRLGERPSQPFDLFFTHDDGAALEAAVVVIVTEADRERAVLKFQKLERRLVVLPDVHRLLHDVSPPPSEEQTAAECRASLSSSRGAREGSFYRNWKFHKQEIISRI